MPARTSTVIEPVDRRPPRPRRPGRGPPVRRARPASPPSPRSLPPKWFYDDRGSELFDQITRLAGVLPDPPRAGDPAARGAGHRRAHRAPTRSSSWARAPRDKTRTAARRVHGHAAGCAGSCRSTCREGILRWAAAHHRRAPTPAWRCTAWSATSTTTSARSPAAAAASSPSSAAPSATSSRAERARLPGRAGGDAGAGRLAPARHRPGQGPGPPGAGLRRRGRRDRRVQPQRAAGAQPRAAAPTSTPDAVRPRRPLGRRRTSGSRCACAPRRRPARARRRRSVSTVRFAAGEELRTEISAKFRRAGVEAELAAAGLDPRPTGGPTPPATSPSASAPGALTADAGSGAGEVGLALLLEGPRAFLGVVGVERSASRWSSSWARPSASVSAAVSRMRLEHGAARRGAVGGDLVGELVGLGRAPGRRARRGR